MSLSYSKFMTDKNLKVIIPIPEQNIVQGKVIYQNKEYDVDFIITFGTDEDGEYYVVDSFITDDDTPLMEYLRKQDYFINDDL